MKKLRSYEVFCSTLYKTKYHCFTLDLVSNHFWLLSMLNFSAFLLCKLRPACVLDWWMNIFIEIDTAVKAATQTGFSILVDGL